MKRPLNFTIENAVEDDVIVIAGKGHENYQIIGDKTLHFSDQEVAEAHLTKNKNRMIKLTTQQLQPKFSMLVLLRWAS